MYRRIRDFERDEWIVGSEAYLVTICFICGREMGMPISRVKAAKPCHDSCLASYANTFVKQLRENANEGPVHVRDHPSTLLPAGHRGST